MPLSFLRRAVALVLGGTVAGCVVVAPVPVVPVDPYDPTAPSVAGAALLGAGTGAALGAIAGGGRGAAIGAAAGGAIGALGAAAAADAVRVPSYPGPVYAPAPGYPLPLHDAE